MSEIGVTREEIEADPAVQNFREKAQLADSTWGGYSNAIQRYADFTGLTPSELIEEAKQEEINGVHLGDRKIGERMLAFRNSLKEEGLSPNSIHRMLAAVKSLYMWHSINVPKLARDKSLTIRPLDENKDVPSKEMIMKLLNVADLRERAIILSLASSGISTSDFVDLRVRDFKEGYDEETGITKLEPIRKKTGISYITFLSREASQAMMEYLRWRERKAPHIKHPDLIKGWLKHRVYSDDDYLICKRYIPDEYLKVDGEECKVVSKAKPEELEDFVHTDREDLRREEEASLRTVFIKLNERAGTSTEKGKWNILRPHKLRSWFYSTLRNRGCKEEDAEVFMGHKGKGTGENHYFKPEIEYYKEIYLEHMPHLEFFTKESVNVVETAGYRQLQAQLAERDKEIGTLKKQVKALGSQLEELYARKETQKLNEELTPQQAIDRLEEFNVRLREEVLKVLSKEEAVRRYPYLFEPHYVVTEDN